MPILVILMLIRQEMQDTVALLTAEAKYIALYSASQECIWIRRLNSKYGNTSEDPTIIMEYNQSSIAHSIIALTFHSRIGTRQED